MARFLLLLLLAVSSTASAIVIRDDVDDADYRVPASEFPALVDLPGEGHGVLIAPTWVVTAAHAVAWQAGLETVELHGVPRAVARVVMHPGYRQPSHDLIHDAMTSGDATLVMVLVASSDDIALLELAQPVTDVAPVALYDGDELGRITKIVGKGATGTGAAGYDDAAPHRTELRRAFNRISSVDGRWFCYVFDAAPAALPLEGITGNGDSGGPALIEVGSQWRLAGLTSWKVAPGPLGTARLGRYGQASCNVRLGHYRDWIDGVLASRSLASD